MGERETQRERESSGLIFFLKYHLTKCSVEEDNHLAN